MKLYNKITGQLGENFATDHLINKGYQILERNFHNKFGEIDIIAKKGDILIFVEVKTKIGDFFGTPEEMVGRGKLQRVRNMATMYMNGQLLPCQVDVFAVVLNPDNSLLRLTHYENVY
ncbi:hypothetical protein A2872_02670 [Candidatus Gottesmanbacteria bacterium RIFCSPHIGHO2_01_FULL_42_12]|uniref:UPF0102 protein A2872_02670 n=1 Tax=Candidatus Gottesmanbacteria bacterium RIFCSPHIGHO2_01_FULL_42_12 TaxID=1798377 RepID=A0A1F5Z098_9BACT|nr:MAG: hypothetical protein A2872_02670 [Candidatus Gottesmanbacteria bacterium RIFCSPHIGHO2_01_FULL_42_12]